MKELCVYVNGDLRKLQDIPLELDTLLEKCKHQYEYCEKSIMEISNQNINKQVKRIYFGDDFCQLALPTPEEIAELVQYALKNKLELTFVTPPVNDEGILQLKNALERIFLLDPENAIKLEVVCNDWGTVYELHECYSNIKILAGRLLNKSIKEYRYEEDDYKKLYTDEGIEYIKKIALLDKSHENILADYGIKRCDIDVLPQGISIGNPTVKVSLYFPYTFISTGRQCPVRSAFEGMPFTLQNHCNKTCKYISHNCSIKNDRIKLFRKGNAFFQIMDDVDAFLQFDCVDRIVLQV